MHIAVCAPVLPFSCALSLGLELSVCSGEQWTDFPVLTRISRAYHCRGRHYIELSGLPLLCTGWQLSQA